MMPECRLLMLTLYNLETWQGNLSTLEADNCRLQWLSWGIFVAVDRHTAQIPFCNLMSSNKGI